MSTYEQAAAAKAALCSAIAPGGVPPAWSRGVGIGRGQDGSHFVKVNVGKLTEEVRAAIPPEVDGVWVVVEEVGTIVPLSGAG